MPTAFITGITGQDGGYLAERLMRDGWQVHGLVHSADARAEAFRVLDVPAVLHEGDLADPDTVVGLIDDVSPDEIYNLGGVSSVAASWEQPLLTTQVNALGAAAVLEAAWQLRERRGYEVRVLQASSAEIFGVPRRSPQSERTAIAPVSPYGAGKAFAHHLVAIYRSRGLFATSCVLYNHESPRRPPQFVTRKITQAAALIAAGQQDSLQLGNLDVRRDWGWAPDYVDAMVAAVRHPDSTDYVVATGQAHSVAEFVAAAFEHAGLDGWQQYVTRDERFVRPVDAAELVGDAAKAHDLLGWQPTVSFRDMVGRMVDADLKELAS